MESVEQMTEKVQTQEDSTGQKQSFLHYWTEKSTVVRALKISMFVGSCLTIINHGDMFLAGGAPPVWKVLMTYCVPYCVSSFSSAQANCTRKQEAREKANAAT